MDNFADSLLRPGVLVLALAIYVAVWGIGKTLELIFPVLVKAAGPMDPKPMYESHLAMWWNEVGLHMLPVVIGGIFGFIHSDFINGPLKHWDAVMFDCGVGWFNGTLYKGVTKLLSSKLGVTVDPAPSITPVPPAK